MGVKPKLLKPHSSLKTKKQKQKIKGVAGHHVNLGFLIYKNKIK